MVVFVVVFLEPEVVALPLLDQVFLLDVDVDSGHIHAHLVCYFGKVNGRANDQHRLHDVACEEYVPFVAQERLFAVDLSFAQLDESD